MTKPIEIFSINPQLIRNITTIVKEETKQEPSDDFLLKVLLIAKSNSMTDKEICKVLKAILKNKSDFAFLPSDYIH